MAGLLRALPPLSDAGPDGDSLTLAFGDPAAAELARRAGALPPLTGGVTARVLALAGERPQPRRHLTLIVEPGPAQAAAALDLVRGGEIGVLVNPPPDLLASLAGGEDAGAIDGAYCFLPLSVGGLMGRAEGVLFRAGPSASWQAIASHSCFTFLLHILLSNIAAPSFFFRAGERRCW